MMKKAIISLSMMGLFLLFQCSQSYANTFSEQYQTSNLKAFLKNGSILFEQRYAKDRTAELICISVDEQTQWKIELPWSEYGGSVLGQAGDDIFYAYRSLDHNILILNRYSQAGDLLSTYSMPKDTGMCFLVKNYVYFISDGNLKFCDANGKVSSIATENSIPFVSLFRAVGNDAKHVFLLSTKTAKDAGCMLLALDQNRKEFWTYPLETVSTLNANEINIAISLDGHVCIADFSTDEDDRFGITLLNEWGNEMWTKKILLPVGENAWLSLIHMSNDGIIQLWGSARSPVQSISSWKMTIDYNGEVIEKYTYPDWIDFVSFTNEEPYGVLDPQGTPTLIREKDIDWVIQK